MTAAAPTLRVRDPPPTPPRVCVCGLAACGDGAAYGRLARLSRDRQPALPGRSQPERREPREYPVPPGPEQTRQ